MIGKETFIKLLTFFF